MRKVTAAVMAFNAGIQFLSHARSCYKAITGTPVTGPRSVARKNQAFDGISLTEHQRQQM